MPSVRVKLAGAPGPFAEVRVSEGDTVARLAARACAAFPSWRLDASQVFLHLLAAGGDEEPAQGAAATALAGSSHLASGWSLARAGVSPGAWLLARAAAASPPALPRTVTLVVHSEDEFGERGATSLAVTLSTQEELKELVKSHGGGSLVALGASTAARRLEELVPGDAYTLVGGQMEAIRHHRSWTQQADRALELTATEAVRDASEKDYGKLAMSTNATLKNLRGEEREFDGLLVNATTAIAVEAKHAAVPKHVELVLAKAAFLLRLALEGSDGRLRGVTGVVPVLASSYFSAAMVALCAQSGVGVVKPNGSGHTYIPAPPPLSLAAAPRRSLALAGEIPALHCGCSIT